MKKYIFVGAVSHVAGLEYNAVGQSADFSDEYFVEALAGGASFLPEDRFAHHFEGFPPEQLAQYSDPYFFGVPSSDYTARVEACRDEVRALRAELCKVV